MCRYVMTEQLLGATFVNLVEKSVFEIAISTFNRLEKKIDTSIREKNNAILCVSIHEIYSTVDEYSDFFRVSNDELIIQEKIREKIEDDKTKRDEFVNILNKYFTTGIPEDIDETVKSVLSEEL